MFGSSSLLNLKITGKGHPGAFPILPIRCLILFGE
jgi:hypothetical protein